MSNDIKEKHLKNAELAKLEENIKTEPNTNLKINRIENLKKEHSSI